MTEEPKKTNRTKAVQVCDIMKRMTANDFDELASRLQGRGMRVAKMALEDAMQGGELFADAEPKEVSDGSGD